jgi:hypothetical protein
MKRSIIFRGDGVLAILEDRKTQTRRVIKFPATPKWMQGIEHRAMKVAYPMPMGGWVFWDVDMGQEFSDKVYQNDPDGIRCPYGQPGDRLWCRETFVSDGDYIGYKADNNPANENALWSPSIFMPRWASRITLEIVNMQVERIQEITWRECIAEGISSFTVARGALSDPPTDPRWKFIELWNSINAKRGYGWDVNTWVWVIEFKKLEQHQ